MFKDRVQKQILAGEYELLKKYDDGKRGTNEVGHIKLKDGTDIIQKVMLGVRILLPDGKRPPAGRVRGRQRRKALYEVTSYLLDKHIGGQTVIPPLYVDLFKTHKKYEEDWGKKNVEGWKRVCTVVREYAPKWSGEDWRGELYKSGASLGEIDAMIHDKICHSLDAQRIAVLDMLTINQDRSANNWAADGERFYAIDNGMSWFHEFPGPDDWRLGCVIDDVILQVGRFPGDWRFISGVFSTAWAGNTLHPSIYEGMKNFDKEAFFKDLGDAMEALDFPRELTEDWRFFAILKRMEWMVENNQLPPADVYRGWLEGSEYMTPPEVVKSGGKIVWRPDWDK